METKCSNPSCRNKNFVGRSSGYCSKECRRLWPQSLDRASKMLGINEPQQLLWAFQIAESKIGTRALLKVLSVDSRTFKMWCARLRESFQ